ncbi:MAG: NADP-dependent oxidoreductase [Candidatus Aminicenantales bacterium]
MTGILSREIRLKNRPFGLPKEEDFEVFEVRIPEIKEGEVLVRNLYMSVDPYMRGRMDERESYTAPFELGKPLEGGCVGQVVESKSGDFRVGDYVSHMKGWREYSVSDGSELIKIDPRIAPIQTYLGILGMTGLTAYVGLLDIGKPKKGETVFVSAAAGAVGSAACQIAKIKGCRVIASTGSDEKVSWLLEEVGVDKAFNYKKAERLMTELKTLAPDGIDIYFDNVGGRHLEAAIACMNLHGRVVLCGMVSVYNATRPPRAPMNLVAVIPKRLALQGFIVSDHFDRQPEFFTDMGRWIREGKIRWKETVFEGVENAPKAFIGLFQGENLGKMLVKL